MSYFKIDQPFLELLEQDTQFQEMRERLSLTQEIYESVLRESSQIYSKLMEHKTTNKDLTLPNPIKKRFVLSLLIALEIDCIPWDFYTLRQVFKKDMIKMHYYLKVKEIMKITYKEKDIYPSILLYLKRIDKEVNNSGKFDFELAKNTIKTWLDKLDYRMKFKRVVKSAEDIIVFYLKQININPRFLKSLSLNRIRNINPDSERFIDLVRENILKRKPIDN